MSTNVEQDGFGGMRADARRPEGPGVLIARVVKLLIWGVGVASLALAGIRLGRAMNIPLFGGWEDVSDDRQRHLPYSQVLPQTDIVVSNAVEPDAPPPTPEPLPTVVPIPLEIIEPNRLVIPSIDLDAPVIPVGYRVIEQGGQQAVQWAVPNERAVGWHALTAGLGEAGNTVLNGHNNAFGEVFRDLIDVNIGDLITTYADGHEFLYRVTEKHVLDERDQPLEVREANAEWIMPTSDERLTLVTCWPYTSNTHRLIIVARPASVPLDLFGEGAAP